MGTFRSSVVALIVLVGALVPAVPAAADEGYGRPGVYQPYYPSIWQGLYGGIHLGWAGPAMPMVPLGEVRSVTTGNRSSSSTGLRPIIACRHQRL